MMMATAIHSATRGYPARVYIMANMRTHQAIRAKPKRSSLGDDRPTARAAIAVMTWAIVRR